MRRPRKRELAAAAGAVAAAGLGACGTTTTVCDPPPPALCGLLERNPSTHVTADRTVVPPDSAVRFTGTVVDTLVKRIMAVDVYAEAGTVTGVEFTLPRSFAFTWTARREGGLPAPGRYLLHPALQVVAYTAEDDSTHCGLGDPIAVDVDSTGTATVAELPGPGSALGLHFEVAVAAGATAGGGVALTARVNLPGRGRDGLRYRWRSSAGEILGSGAEVVYRPDPAVPEAVIQVEAWSGESDVTVGSWTWRRP